MKTAIAIAIISIFCLGCSQKSELSNKASSELECQTVECDMFNAINNVRVNNGVAPLSWNSTCAQMASDHSEDMVARNYFSHDSPTETYAQRVARYHLNAGWAGENIARSASVASAVNQWMNSTGHRNNILNTNFRSTGIGYFENHWVQCFTSLNGSQ